MNKTFLAFLLSFAIFNSVFAQVSEQYVVASPTLTMRSGDSKEHSTIKTLSKNDAVVVLDTNANGWWNVEYNGTQGFVVSQFLKKRSNDGWLPATYQTGDDLNCDSAKPLIDKNLDNHLKISVNSNSDVVVKLMQINKTADISVRTAFIESGDVLVMKNIPEGKYYLKIAYGNDWREKKVGKKCTGRFIENAVYEIGKERLSFKLVQLSSRLDIPSYSLSLGGKAKQADATFTTTHITEAEFNK